MLNEIENKINELDLYDVTLFALGVMASIPAIYIFRRQAYKKGVIDGVNSVLDAFGSFSEIIHF